jgi:hypothetical protein
MNAANIISGRYCRVKRHRCLHQPFMDQLCYGDNGVDRLRLTDGGVEQIALVEGSSA